MTERAVGERGAVDAPPAGMEALVAAHPWPETPLGAVASWPEGLRAAARIMLTSRFAMWLGWGPELTFLYNDAYARMTLGGKHPWALGRPAREVWAEIWEDIRPRIESVMTTGVASWDEALRLMLERNGYREETYHTFSYSPLEDDDGHVAGMLCVVSEDTERVIGERRLATLSRLSTGIGEAGHEAETARSIMERLAQDPRDLPFVAIHQPDGEGGARLMAATGLAPDDAIDRWLRSTDAVTRGEASVLMPPGGLRAKLPCGPWESPPAAVVVLPLGASGGRDLGTLTCGTNPFRPRDRAYDGFLELVAGQVGAELAAVRAYEDERRRAIALAELDRAKTEFFSNVSHEFRTPLTLILGPVEAALASPAGALGQEELRAVHRNALRMLRLVSSLLDFSRLEAGRLAADRQAVDLGALTADLAAMFRSVAEAGDLRFDVEVAAVTAAVDAGMWERIVLNLISNAYKHTFEGSIAVRLAADDGQAVLTVTDTGVGIPDDELDHVFERFHRVAGSRARSHEGTGIGLAMVQSLVALHGGTVRVRSQVGRGTTFEVRVPLEVGPEEQAPAATAVGGLGFAGQAPRPAAPPSGQSAEAWIEEARRWGGADTTGWLPPDSGTLPSQAPATPSAGPRPRVLVADDNADMRGYLERLLVPSYDVELVADGRRALDAAIKRPPDMIVTDVMMPFMDGEELIRALRENPRTRHVPVLLLSARAGEAAQMRGLDAGADDYLVKPFAVNELLARVRAHIRLAQQRTQALQLRDAFVGLVSHELRTPVTTIFGAARILENGTTTEEIRAELVRDIASEADRLRTLVEDLLALARLDGGELSVGSEPVIMGHLARRLSRVKGAPWSARQVQVRSGDVVARADAVYTEQVLRNLLSNAAKYSPERSPITIDIRGEPGRAEVRVLDEGVGIDIGDQDRLFQMYYRSPDVATRVSGAGIGLYVCRQVIEAMGGGVWVAPRDGPGTEFGFWLPEWQEDPA